MNDDVTQAGKVVGDIASITVAVGTVFKWLPAVAAIFTIIWTGIRIYETKTVQSLLGRKP